MKPFLRWIGGKTKIVNFLVKFVPENIERHRYWEPFLGAGSLYFALQPPMATISDLNSELIWCYKAIKENPELIYKYLMFHKRFHNKDYYYRIRDKYNQSKQSIARAAMFLYLNKTCFNGIWRVNLSGNFNVPYGNKEYSSLPSMAHLTNISKLLKTSQLLSGDYREILKNAKGKDFIYLDPPYPPLSVTSNFTHYTIDRFSLNDHLELAKFVSELDAKGCRVLLSNASTEYIKSLYNGYNKIELDVTRWVRSDGKRYKAKEVIISNYNFGN